MSFAAFYWLYLLPIVLVGFLVLFCYAQKLKHKHLQEFVAQRLLESLMPSYSVVKTRIKYALIIASVLLIIIALARPQWGYEWKEVRSKGIDILFALDASNSMLAEDLKPNRLDRAKFAILDFVNSLQGNRVGLIAFAGSAFLQCPLTLDYDAFRQTLEAIDTNTVGHGGTDLAAAIDEATQTFSEDNNFKILILITDGEDLEASGIDKAKKAHDQHGLAIYTVGVGTVQGELIPLLSKTGQRTYLRDSSGQVVKTRLDEKTLRKLSESAGGFYVPLGARGEGLAQIYERGLKSIPKEDISTRMQQVPLEKYYWPLGLAVCLLIIELLMSQRKSQRYFLKRQSLMALSILFIGLIFTQPLEASVSAANRWYNEGNYERAAQYYQKMLQKKPAQGQLYYNLGTSLYKMNDYEGALATFKQALTYNEIELHQNIFYNLGNTSYRLGASFLNANPQKTIEIWEEGLSYYDNALELDPEDKEAIYNRDFLKEKLEELKKKEQQKESSQEQNKSSQQQEQDQQRHTEERTQEGEQKEEQQNQQQSQSSQQREQKEHNEKQSEGSSEDDRQESSQKTQDSESQQEQQEPSSRNQHSGKRQTTPDKNSSKETLGSSNKAPYDKAMTKREAAQLLDSLKQSEEKLPITGWGNTAKNEEQKKNW